MGVNKQILVGRVYDSPSFKELKGDQVVVCSFVVSTQDALYKSTLRHKVVAFGKLAERCKRKLRQGSKVYVEGSSYPHYYRNQSGQLVFAQELRANVVLPLATSKLSQA